MAIHGFRGIAILAPMMKGGNEYFRRIARKFGADIQCGSMAFAHKVVARDVDEIKLVTPRKPGAETFCPQITGNDPRTVAEAARIIEDRGANALDLNCGCPKMKVVSRGMGSGLLRRGNLGTLVEMIGSAKRAVRIPVTAKVRAGYNANPHTPQIEEIVQRLEEAGVDAITVHGRYRTEFFGHKVRWEMVGRAVAARHSVPIIANGDIRQRGDVLWYKKNTGCDSVSIARAALHRPWIFQEIREGRDLWPNPQERWGIFQDLYESAREDVRRNPALIRDLLRFHAGWYIGWHEMERTVRHVWSMMDVLDPKTETMIIDTVRDITLRGPKKLPQLLYQHTKNRDNAETMG